jgi:hypothetical protein
MRKWERACFALDHCVCVVHCAAVVAAPLAIELIHHCSIKVAKFFAVIVNDRIAVIVHLKEPVNLWLLLSVRGRIEEPVILQLGHALPAINPKLFSFINVVGLPSHVAE